MKRRIAVITGARADYGLLYWLIHDLHHAEDMELQLLATGMHLMPEFGNTIEVIRKDGFPVAEEVDLGLVSDEPEAIAVAMGRGMIGFAGAFSRLRPDLVVILGDRFEMLSAASAAFVQRIPIAHIHGGEVTEGALDEGFRHAITKLSHLHFTAAEPYRRRVIQMGEQPSRVFDVGAPGLDHLRRSTLLSREALEHALDFKLGRMNFLVTFHPATLDLDDAATQCKELLTALDAFEDARIIFTLPNADPGGRAIIPLLEDYTDSHAGRCALFASLGQLRYLSLMKEVQVVIGNSSSGIIEAPALGVPTVNIGDRQRGRLRARSVLDCPPLAPVIASRMREALSPEFRRACTPIAPPYGGGHAAGIMLQILRETDFRTLRYKRFHDLDFVYHPHEAPA